MKIGKTITKVINGEKKTLRVDDVKMIEVNGVWTIEKLFCFCKEDFKNYVINAN